MLELIAADEEVRYSTHWGQRGRMSMCLGWGLLG